jgi:hypothetical protein
MNRFTRLFKLVSNDDDEDFLWHYNNMDMIVEPNNRLGALYLGNVAAANDTKTLVSKDIPCVLTVAGNCALVYTKDKVPFHKVIPASDTPEYKLERYFEECFDWIH